MSDASSYWSPLCLVVSGLRCWARIVSKASGGASIGRWGQLLAIPVENYLEASGGPVPMRDVECVELSTCHIRGGMAGRPLEILSIKEKIVARLRETQVTWELYEGTWSIERVFEEQPVQIVRVANPFGAMRAEGSRSRSHR